VKKNDQNNRKKANKATIAWSDTADPFTETFRCHVRWNPIRSMPPSKAASCRLRFQKEGLHRSEPKELKFGHDCDKFNQMGTLLILNYSTQNYFGN
jgi:hypothetical protein